MEYSETEFATTLRGFAKEIDAVRKGFADKRLADIKTAKQQSRQAVRYLAHLPPTFLCAPASPRKAQVPDSRPWAGALHLLLETREVVF